MTLKVAQHPGNGRRLKPLGAKKLPAEPLPFGVSDTNDAIAKIVSWFTENWRS